MSDYDPQNDYYLILGLDSPTSSQLVQSAFLQKKAILGPPTPGNAMLREQLDLAYYHLSDVVRRAHYDKEREKYRLARRAAADDEVFQAAAAAANTPAGPPPKPKGEAKITAYESASPGGLKMLEERIESFPDDYETMTFLAFQYYSSNLFDQAAKLYTRYLRARPTDPDAHYYCARAFQRINQMKFAASHFRKVVELAPDSERAEKSRDALNEIGG